MNSYVEAQAMYTNTRKRKLQNNTYLVKTENGYGIRLHDTVVVEYLPDRTILNSGGWKTATTKKRMNCYMPHGWQVIQTNGVWYIKPCTVDWLADYVFTDGCYYKDKRWHNTGPDPKVIQKQRASVRKYVRDFIDQLVKREIPKPSAGDCWYCTMTVTSPEEDKGKTLGEATQDDHVQHHIEEKYYVPSLLVRAVEQGGVSEAARHCVGYWLGYHEQRAEFWEDIAKQQVNAALKRYCYRQLGLVG